MRIEEIDKNLKTESAMGLTDVVFLDVRRTVFAVRSVQTANGTDFPQDAGRGRRIGK